MCDVRDVCVDSIDVWEVFILLSRLNDDWGWGRSQHSKESGLIPLMIMEDVVREGGERDSRKLLMCTITVHKLLCIILYTCG